MLQIIVDLAVKTDDEGAVLVRHGLMPSSTQINDGKSAMSQPNTLLRV